MFGYDNLGREIADFRSRHSSCHHPYDQLEALKVYHSIQDLDHNRRKFQELLDQLTPDEAYSSVPFDCLLTCVSRFRLAVCACLKEHCEPIPHQRSDWYQSATCPNAAVVLNASSQCADSYPGASSFLQCSSFLELPPQAQLGCSGRTLRAYQSDRLATYTQRLTAGLKQYALPMVLAQTT
jgi:hypothetical protein